MKLQLDGTPEELTEFLKYIIIDDEKYNEVTIDKEVGFKIKP